MLEAITRALDRFRGSGDAAVTVPPMDGALRPNFSIENASLLHSIEAPDNLVSYAGTILFSSGSRLLELRREEGSAVERELLSSPVTCLASHASGTLAIGLAEGTIRLSGGLHDGTVLTQVGDRKIVCATAATFADADTLLVCLGSQQCPAADWKHDLMANHASGSVWRIDLKSLAATCLADALAYPYGIVADSCGRIIVSESWRHRIVQVAPESAPLTLYGDIPGYPARMVLDLESKELWLAVFAPRLQLIEFVLREDEYRKRMMKELDPEWWIAPSLHHPASFLEPLQGGGLKQLGELKPWAPSRSYGLLVRLDADCQPIESFHSRANGTRHGVTSCLPDGSSVIVASKGGDAIVAIEH
ncbi:strictosidine synthase [Aquibium sp. LZ166]|uniref:Strictosidine synthase n=1 Tax=Aquibium pacificus TaxID=3153579 RepID=A0ABV3SEV6_9HYPH